jgi:Fe-S cluster assembly protein SufD
MNLQAGFVQFNSKMGSGAWSEVRHNAFQYFSKKGLPSKKQEYWKYTGFQFLTEERILPTAKKSYDLKELKASLASYLSPQFINLVFVDQVLVAELSNITDLKKSAKFEYLSETNKPLNEFKSIRNQLPKVRQDSLEALNASFFENGISISLGDHVTVEKPVQMIFFSHSPGAQYPKVFFSVGAGSSVHLVETVLGGSQENFTDSVVEINLQKSASLNFVRLQDQALDSVNVATHRIYLQEKSALTALSYSTGGSISRHNLDIYCMGEGAQAVVNGLTMSAVEQHMDNHTNIEHVVGGCTTTQLYKSILEDKSRVVFNGRVHIHPNAQKASSDQLNNNLLLSSQAEADSKPQLEIHADDVKATHGSTVGPMDAEELFYFQSRAISSRTAMEMLSLGFVKELIDLNSHSLIRDFLNRHLLAAYRRMKNHGV